MEEKTLWMIALGNYPDAGQINTLARNEDEIVQIINNEFSDKNGEISWWGEKIISVEVDMYSRKVKVHYTDFMNVSDESTLYLREYKTL